MYELSISVVIPCYNGGSFLREMLDSVLAQTYLPLEVLVVDDGSTDNSAEIAEGYGEPVRVIRQENQGESVARNRGIDESQGNWIAFIDADDLWEPEKLEKQVRVIDAKTVAVHTNYYNFGKTTGVCDQSEIPAETRYSLENVARHSPLNTSTLLVRKSTCPRFPEWTIYAEDKIFQLELVQCGQVKLVAEPLAGYRRHAASQSGGDPKIHIHWHETLMQWLANEPEGATEEIGARIRKATVLTLIEAAQMAKWQRDWPNFELLCSYLRQYEDLLEVQEFLRAPKLPKFVYQLKDWLVPSK